MILYEISLFMHVISFFVYILYSNNISYSEKYDIIPSSIRHRILYYIWYHSHSKNLTLLGTPPNPWYCTLYRSFFCDIIEKKKTNPSWYPPPLWYQIVYHRNFYDILEISLISPEISGEIIFCEKMISFVIYMISMISLKFLWYHQNEEGCHMLLRLISYVIYIIFY